MNFDGFISYSHAADGRLAPAVHRGLHRLAKPWHHRRALWIFRDQTGLSVTPALWSSIQQALDGSEWFVLLASPDAARSPWVNREIEHWIATKPAGRILPVVTDGEWRWDAELGDLSADSTAVPDSLRGVFAEEPLFLDLRWARDDRHLSLQHARFRNAIAQLAAPMHGVSKDELEGEDVRQHRRAWRLRWVAAMTLVLLTVVAALTGVRAERNAGLAAASVVEAQHQQQVASQQRGNAERSAELAQRQEENARAQEARARAATTETKRQEKHAREQQAVAERASAEADRQQQNARRQQQLADRARTLAEQQQAVAREQSELARQAGQETARQRIIAEQQLKLAAEAAADAERQRRIARQQQRVAEEAAAEARRQEAVARENERKAKEAVEEARRQEKNAAEQKQITVGRRLINQAKATISNDPATALRLGIAAQSIQPGSEARGELSGLLASTRHLGTLGEGLSVSYGPGNVAVVIETDYNASLWNVADPAAPVQLSAIEDWGDLFVGQARFSPDGRTLAVLGGWDWAVVLFDVSDPTAPSRIGTIPVPEAGWLTFSPDGQTLAIVTIDDEWSLWSMADRMKPALLTSQTKGHRGPVTFSPDGRTLVIAGTPGTVWDVTDRTRPTQVGTLDGGWQAVAYSPTRRLLATNGADGNLALWHMENPAKPRRFFMEAVRATASSFSPDGLTLATTDTDGSARLWDVTANVPVHMADLNDHSGYGARPSFSSDGRTLATVGETGALSLWTVGAHGEPTTLGRAVGGFPSGVVAALSSDGKRLTTTHFDGTAIVWDMSNPAAPVERVTTRIHPSHVGVAAISPNGDTVAALGLAGSDSVTLTDLSDPGAPRPLPSLGGGRYDRAMTFSPDGRTLAVGSAGSDLMLWDLTDRNRPAMLTTLATEDLVAAVAFSPDGRTVAVAGATGRVVELWNVSDRSNPTRVAMLKGHSDLVLAMAFSPDGRTLATGSADKTVTLWNVTDPARLTRRALITGNGAPVWSLAFSPDGRTLAIGTKGNAAALWDVTELSGPVRVASLQRAYVGTESLLFHPDGRTLTTSGSNYGDTRAVVWDYSRLNELRADPARQACAVTGGGLTPDEWAAYIPEAPYRPTCPR